MKSYSKLLEILNQRKDNAEGFGNKLLDVGIKVGLTLSPILEHFGLLELIVHNRRINLTLMLDEVTLRIPWELAILIDDPSRCLCERVNIGRATQVRSKEGWSDALRNKGISSDYKALVVGLDYKKYNNRLYYSEADARSVHRYLTRFARGKKSKGLEVHPLRIGENAKKALVERRLKEGLTLFHFSGHGSLKERIGKITLANHKNLSTRKVQDLLREVGTRAPAFSFLNACETCLQKPVFALLAGMINHLSSNLKGQGSAFND